MKEVHLMLSEAKPKPTRLPSKAQLPLARLRARLDALAEGATCPGAGGLLEK